LTLSLPDEGYSNLLTLSLSDEGYSNLLTLSLPDEGYLPFTLNYRVDISTFLNGERRAKGRGLVN
jgi:hypothetical protein